MDNTDVKQPLIRTRTFRNVRTGEVKTVTMPVPDRPAKKVIARGKGKKTVGKILIARLLPFRSAMIEGLRRHGISVARLPFKTVISLYYNTFCLTDSTKKPLDVFEFINNVAFRLNTTDEPNGDVTEARNETAFGEIAATVDHIIACFKGSKEKYFYLKGQGLNPNQYLTDQELLEAKACRLVEMDLVAKASSDHYIKVADVGYLLKWFLFFALVYYILRNS